MKIRDRITFNRSIVILILFTLVLILHLIPTSPNHIQTASILDLEGDFVSGERVFFHAAGCGGCHLGSNRSKNLLLAGGTAVETQFGTFYAPYVSMSKEYGIDEWSLEDFYRVIKLG